MKTNRKQTFLTSVAFLALASFNSFAAQEYIYDYHVASDPAEYLANYQGTPFKEMNIDGALFKVEAEDFDIGGEGVAWNFKQEKTGNDYRDDVTKVGINKGASGYVLGNITNGDWFCYTVNITTAGEYRLTTNMSSDVNNTYYFEVDGNSTGKILSIKGQGWRDYMDISTDGVQLTEGKHVIRWCTNGSVNFDYFTLEKIGDYVDTTTGISFTYPRTYEYNGNPMFATLTSPMWQNGFVGNLYTADPSAHVWKNKDGEDVLYVYASHDMEPPKGCGHMDRYHVFSTKDMVTWTDHGEIMNATTSNHYTNCVGEGLMWAPDCAYNPNDGKYYFIYPHAIDSCDGVAATELIEGLQNPEAWKRWAHFLAVSDNPTGPFECLGYIDGIPSTIDPCIFVDDDGEAYIFTSGGNKCWGARLKKDNWLELDTEITPMLGVDGGEKSGFTDFHEAPFMIKRNGIYYLFHADNNNPNNQIRYSTAENPLGPFTPQGIVMYAHGHDTHHNSMVEFKGKWYSFYHTGDYSGQGNLRSVCFDEASFTEDGKVNIVNTWGTPYSGSPIAITNEDVTTINAVEFNNGGRGRGYFKHNVELQRNLPISLENDEWVRYSINVAKAGRYGISIKARQINPNTTIAIATNGYGRTSYNGVTLPENRNVTDVQELYIFPLNLPAGEQYLELRVKNGTMEISDISLGRGQANVPGIIQAEDLDATDYKFQQTAAINHSYRDDVDVAIITYEGITRIGNTTINDYYSYTFNVTEEGRYKVVSRVSTGAGKGAYTLTFDEGSEAEMTFSQQFDQLNIDGRPNAWNNYTESTIEQIDLTAGVHKMKFTVNKPLNVDYFEFVRVGDIPEPIDPSMIINEIPGAFLGGDIDGTEGSYYFKQLETNPALKNEYAGNPDVKARIKANGQLGNLTRFDYFHYNLNVTKSANYQITLICEAPLNGNGRCSLIFDDNESSALSVSAPGQNWNIPVTHDCGSYYLEAGEHRMKVTVLEGLNVNKFEFSEMISSDIESIFDSLTEPQSEVNVYSIDGRWLKKGFDDGLLLNGLDAGIYIVGNKKVIKR